MKFTDPKKKCLFCYRVGVDLHHVKSRGSGGSNEPHNLMPLCHSHHVEIEQIGPTKFIEKEESIKRVSSVKNWLLINDWYLNTSLKWVHPKEKY